MGAMGQSKESEISDKYRAPALEKGLDILELLAKSSGPLQTMEIAARLNRSKAELYRMLQVLESRGYVAQEPGGGYQNSRKMLEIGAESHPVRDMLEYALPAMRMLTDRIAQSCHIAVASREKIVVIARAESQALLNFAVRVGASQQIPAASSGRVLFAFQTEQTRATWLRILHEEAVLFDQAAFVATSDTILKRGYELADSAIVKGVRDISAPIIALDHAIASLTVPFIEKMQSTITLEEASKIVVETAGSISSAIKLGSVRGV